MINIGEIFVANGTGILVLVVSLLSRIERKKQKHISDRFFNAMIGITMIALVAETATFLLDGKDGTAVHIAQYLLNGYLFLASSGVGALWVLYVDNRIYHSRKRLKGWLLPVLLPYAVIILMVMCDLCGAGLIFSVNEQNVYQRGDLVILPYIVLLYDYFISIALALFAVKRNNHVRFFPIHYFVIPCFIGTVVQHFNYGLSTGWLCVSLAFQFIQMHLYNQNAFVDDLSGLYNRKYYDCVIDKLASSKRKRTVAGIMMDIDRFKSINDEFGHSEGDDAIRNLGKLLSDITSEHTMAFRHAGDEFIVLVVDEDESYVKKFLDSFYSRIEAFNGSSQKPYKLELSVGYTICDAPGLDKNLFLHKMDRKMYEQKAAHYAEKNIDRRG